MLTIYKAVVCLKDPVYFESKEDANKYVCGKEEGPAPGSETELELLFGTSVTPIQVFGKGEFVQEAVDRMKALQKLTPHERQLLGL